MGKEGSGVSVDVTAGGDLDVSGSILCGCNESSFSDAISLTACGDLHLAADALVKSRGSYCSNALGARGGFSIDSGAQVLALGAEGRNIFEAAGPQPPAVDGMVRPDPEWGPVTLWSFCPVCGDGRIGGTEECDDGNLVDGDGCSSTCLIE
ncbi:MAG: DUF4215 domain-containing protein [Candidatus Dadabacteria bacterium]|nr:MAG: DUF4215 domain-containing protein [Candidatus Dadabacteria bacterium]